MSSTVITAIDLLVRVTILLGIGSLAALIAHRRSASFRHLLWSSSLGGALVLALLVPWSPRITVPIRVVTNGTTNGLSIPAAEQFDRVPVRAGVIINSLGAQREPWTEMPSTPVADLPPLWLLLWGLGTALVIAWAAFGRVGLALIERRSAAVTSDPWREIVDATRVQLGVRRPIAIYQNDKVGAPMTWGMLRPVLVVPPESVSWSNALRQSVAAHEVAHVARRDYLIQLMATLACAVYWFHPLAWFMARRMRQAAERACDDQVLALGATGDEYAAHLIGVARSARHLRLSGAVAIGMARPSTLEGRIVAVLDEARSRSTPGATARRTVAGVTALALIVVGTVRPVAATPVESEPIVLNDVVVPVPLPRKAAELSETPANGTAGASVTTVQNPDSVIERTLDASPGGLLTLDLDAGGSVTVRGWDDDRVRVRAGLGGINWRDIDVAIERESRGGVRVDARFVRQRRNQSSDNHFEITVPRRYDVRISSAGGSLTMTGIEGRFTGHTGGGNLSLERMTGTARLTTGGGEIDVRNSDLAGTVTTGGGMVRLSNVKGGLRGSSGSGPVVYGTSGDRSDRSTTDIGSVRVDESRIIVGRDTDYRSGTLNIEKAGGDIDLDAAPNGARVNTGGGDVRVGRSAGTVEASTGGGDVTVGPVAGSVVAGTGAGTVRIIVDRAREPQIIEATSGSGRIIIELPADFDGRLELETAYTRTHEDRARITSDWDLERDPLTDWEDRYGTPRRFLRARTVLGRGTGRVVVRTVNGDIEIRRR